MPYSATNDDVEKFIRRVEDSKVLGRSSRRLLLLEHLLRSEVEGNGAMLKAYSIGLDIFQKGADFDPSTDSIVRVEMGRIRTALAAFEGTSFADTNVVVTIPKGTYRPSIELRSVAEVEQNASESDGRSWLWKATAGCFAIIVVAIAGLMYASWSERPPDDISIAVKDFTGLSEAASLAKSALLSGLSRSSTIATISLDDGVEDTKALFVVTGSATQTENGVLVVAELKHRASNRIEWAKSLSTDELSKLPQLVENQLTRELRVHLYGAFKRVLEQRDLNTLSAEELFVLATWVPGPATNAADWEEERIRLAQLAIEKDRDFGKAHSVLADKLAYLANMHAPANFPEVGDRVVFHAQRALELDPLNPDVVFNAAQGLWHSGQISQSKRMMERVVQLDPSHDLARFLSNVIPYTCAAAPDAVLETAVAFDKALSSDNPIRWLTLTWIGWLHAYRDEWEAALDAEEEAALIFEIPYTSMRHAMILNEMGRVEDAKAVIQRQRANWPKIDPTHFAEVTIPRLCQGALDRAKYTKLYSDLAESLAD